MDTQQVTSADGTVLTVETVGTGPPVVLVSGAFCDRTTTRFLARRLAPARTVHAFDRRGRGDSGGQDRPPEVAAEVADLAAVVEHTGGEPVVYGHSSGAILALEAAMAGVPVRAVAVYEPPWSVDDHRHDGMADDVRDLLAEGRPGDAAARFLAATGVAPDALAELRASPAWAGFERLAPSLPHDLALAAEPLPAERLGALRLPLLVLDGGDSDPWARRTTAAVTAVVPGAQRRTMEGQGHAVDQEALVQVLLRFLAELATKGR